MGIFAADIYKVNTLINCQLENTDKEHGFS